MESKIGSLQGSIRLYDPMPPRMDREAFAEIGGFVLKNTVLVTWRYSRPLGYLAVLISEAKFPKRDFQ